MQKEDQKFNRRQPTVMQVLPALITGGVERGTVDIACAVAEGGGRSLVVSAGGPMVQELKRSGIEHFELPVASKNPLDYEKKCTASDKYSTRPKSRYYTCPVTRSSLECLARCP